MMYGKKLAIAAFLVLAAGSLCMTGCSSKSNAAPEDPNLTALKTGNANYLAGVFTNLLNNSTSAVRTTLAAGQSPKTVILTCADSRVPPEIIFNKGLGELFVIRVAGNIVGTYEIASIEYAVEHLGATQIIVLGHSKCGAVKEAFNNYSGLRAFRSLAGKPGFGNLSSLVNAIRPAVTIAAETNTNATLWEASIDENVRLVKEQILSRSTILEEKVSTLHEVTLLGAKYDISTGAVDFTSLNAP